MIGQRMVAGVVLLFVFSLGALAGIFWDRHVHTPSPAGLTAEGIHEAAMAELRDVLALDEQQVEQIHAIMADRQELVQSIWEQIRPEVQAAMRDVHAEIAALLRPDQVERYHEWLRRQHTGEDDGVLVIPH